MIIKRILPGAWRQPEYEMDILGHQMGFIKYYKRLSGCAVLGKVDVGFYQPRGLDKPYRTSESGQYKGKIISKKNLFKSTKYGS